MKHWERTLIAPATTLREALAVIDAAGCQIALVVGPDRRLLGTLSDGDLRRGLLRGLSLSDPASAVMHPTPTSAREGDAPRAILGKMRRLGLHQMPVVDESGRVIGLQTVDDELAIAPRPHEVVIMAGGLGTRLRELTADTPKPMLRVGSRPLLETLILSYAEQGFHRFHLAVNYKAEQIVDHFGDGQRLGVQIDYLRETRRLGTAGALGLLAQRPERAFVVSNADLLTREDHGRMVDLHEEAGADATLGVREHEMQVPFGVVREAGGRLLAIEEKPIQRHRVSAGLYVLSPRVLDLVPPDTPLDMPDLFTAMLARGLHARCHPIEGYWLDIGRLPDYERAQTDFEQVFR